MQKIWLAPLAHNHEISLKRLVFLSRSNQECYKHMYLCTNKIFHWPTRYWDHKRILRVRGESFIGSLVIIYTFLVLKSKSCHKCNKHEDITIPTKYVTDQQDIEILKNFTVYDAKYEILGSLAPLARNHLWNFSIL